ncbi:hypothetical protein CNMCM5793_006023 [Aspergillus hiratsukae]|uniref:Uncharacterized protein n=1 Tax=Aspergillus hiratsukae TaxID=1194566 RepID=A0A8H6UIJ7_9EURO|nr:hypothetical protein CNMCM5793_006023 [Aspergillus hiratsukae]
MPPRSISQEPESGRRRFQCHAHAALHPFENRGEEAVAIKWSSVEGEQWAVRSSRGEKEQLLKGVDWACSISCLGKNDLYSFMAAIRLTPPECEFSDAEESSKCHPAGSCEVQVVFEAESSRAVDETPKVFVIKEFVVKEVISMNCQEVGRLTMRSTTVLTLAMLIVLQRAVSLVVTLNGEVDGASIGAEAVP